LIITALELKNFRNLNLLLTPAPHFNLILGKNGIGKSNLLDALYHLALGKSFKPYTLKNNVNFHDQSFALIRTDLVKAGISKELKIIFSITEDESERKRLEINTKPTTRAKFINNLSLILFAPHNTNLLVSTPDIRRNELDDFASTLDFRYAMKLSEYRSVLRTRNSLLRALSEGFAKASELDYWDEKLAELGGSLIAMRFSLFAALKPRLQELAKQHFAPDFGQLELTYLTKFTDGDPIMLLRNKLKDNRIKEIAAGQTLYGPHKDDFAILNSNKDLKLFGSRGQQRISTLLLKLSMWEQLRKTNHIKPLILLDDAMAELDADNRVKLEEIISELKAQTFVATTHESDYSKKLLKQMEIFRLD
jgi:DNA replication and repair protein RecF